MSHNSFALGMGFIWIPLIFLLIIAMVITIQKINKNSSGGQSSDESKAIGILKERLAKGEIDLEEYDELLEKIKQS